MVGLGSLEVITLGNRAFNKLKLPHPMQGESFIDDFISLSNKTPLVQRVVGKLEEIDTEDYKYFCRSAHEYLIDISRYSSILNNIPVSSLGHFYQELECLRELPDPDELLNKYFFAYTRRMDKIETAVYVLSIGALGIAFAILGGETTDKFIQNNQYINHALTGIATIAGAAAGFLIGHVVNENLHVYEFEQRGKRKLLAENILIERVKEYINNHKINPSPA